MKRIWLISGLVFFVLACNMLAFPGPTPTPENNYLSPSIVTPTSVEGYPTLAWAGGRPFSAIIVRMVPGPTYLLGGRLGLDFLSPEEIVSYLPGRVTYQVFSTNGPVGSIQGEIPVYNSACQSYTVETDSYPEEPIVGIVGGWWNATPRLAQEVLTDHPTYIEILNDWLMEHYISEPVVEISQILRVDIEGDGTDEVFISASHFDESTGHNVANGDYSLVLMRKVMGDSVMTVPVINDYYFQEGENQFPLTYTTLLFADLNLDGVLEILVGVERWEGSGVIAFDVDGIYVRRLFEYICGL